MHIALPDLSFGGVGMQDLQLDYFRDDNGDRVWRGQGTLCFVLACVNATTDERTPPGGVEIRNGEFKRAFMRVDFPDPNPGIMLYPNVFLKSVGAGLKLDPTQVLGSVLVKAIQIYEIEGRVLVAFPSEDQPLTLTPGDFERPVRPRLHAHVQELHARRLGLGVVEDPGAQRDVPARRRVLRLHRAELRARRRRRRAALRRGHHA